METMNTKDCFKCGLNKPLSEFYKHPEMLDGHVNKCKDCNKKDVRTNYAVKKDYYHVYDKGRQRHSRQRIFNHRYSQMKQRIEGRAIRDYGVKGKEFLSPLEYSNWIKNNMDEFEAIYKLWETSGFQRKYTPSIDRINNNGSYTADNMRWVTVSDNTKKGTKPWTIKTD